MKRYVYLAVLSVIACQKPEPLTPDVAVLTPSVAPTANIEVDPATILHEGDALPIEIAINDSQICLRMDGKIHCGGGDDKKTALSAEPAIEGISGATSLALGYGFGCAVANGGQVWCWGGNSNGELGAENETERSEKALRAKGIEKAKRVFSGQSHVCAILENGEVKCWGSNLQGQTGGSTYYEPAAHMLVSPTAVPAVRDAVWGDGANGATCVSTKSKEVWCWGESVFQDQQDARGDQSEQPWKAKALAGVERISGSDRAFCGIKTGAANELLCWGESYGLFTDYRGKTREPRTIKLPEPKRVRVSASHACALAGDGRVYCWGSGYTGALGRDLDERQASGGSILGAEPVADLRAIDITVGGSMSCAITRDYEIFCWGRWPYTGGQRTEKLPVAMRVR